MTKNPKQTSAYVASLYNNIFLDSILVHYTQMEQVYPPSPITIAVICIAIFYDKLCQLIVPNSSIKQSQTVLAKFYVAE